MSGRGKVIEPKAWPGRPYWQRLGLWLLMFCGAIGGVLASLHVVSLAWDAKPDPPPPGARQATGEAQEQPREAAAGSE